MMEFCKLSSQESLDNEPFNVLCTLEEPFTIAANISGPDKLARWLIRKPEAAHRLLRLASDFLIGIAKYWRDTFSVDGVLILLCEPTSSNQMISSKQFEQFALPYIKEVHEEILAMGHKYIYEHICGEQNANLPYWAQVSYGDPGIISIGHEIDLETAAKYFPNDIILGNLNPTVIQTGTLEEVYEASKKVIEKGKNLPGGFIFSPGCETPPMANPDCIMAMTRAVDEFGWYQ